MFLNTKNAPPINFLSSSTSVSNYVTVFFNTVAFTQKLGFKSELCSAEILQLGYYFNNAKQYIENHAMLYNPWDHYHSNINSASQKCVILLHSSLLHKACMYKHAHTYREKLGYFASILIFLRNLHIFCHENIYEYIDVYYKYVIGKNYSNWFISITLGSHFLKVYLLRTIY